MYRDMPEFPCPCTGTSPNSYLSLYMDRAIFNPIHVQGHALILAREEKKWRKKS
jgi:hypothetical protein